MTFAASRTMPADWAEIAERAAGCGLWAFGGLHPEPGEAGVPPHTRTIILLAPDEPAFWPRVTMAPEFSDGGADPLDRWSRRVIGHLACDLGGKALFPFGGPPFRPFIDWALRSGSLHTSPVGLLVHREAGLFASLRGALALRERIALPEPAPSPCPTCVTRPCESACPVAALSAGGSYDVPRCRTHIGTTAGKGCLDGCLVRRACPAGVARPRMTAQSAFHMAAFHKPIAGGPT